MKKSQKINLLGAGLLVGCLFVAIGGTALCQASLETNAQALLQEAKNRELDRQREARVRQIERLNEDLEKDTKEAEDLKQGVEKVNAAAAESATRVSQYTAQKKQFAKLQEVAGLQLDAETLKVEGLKALGEAQMKGVAALLKRVEETGVRTAREKAILTPSSGRKLSQQEVSLAETEWEKRLDRAQRSTSTARVEARAAMAAATTKLQAAKAAEEKARARAAELGIPILAEPAPIVENVEPLKEVDPIMEVAPSTEAAKEPPTAEPEYLRAIPVHPEQFPTVPTESPKP